MSGKISFGDLRDLCEARYQTVLPHAVALAHLDLAAAVLGVDWEQISAEPEDVAARFAECGPDGSDRLRHFGSNGRYLAWETGIFQLVIAAGGGAAGDRWKTIEILGNSVGPGIDLRDFLPPLRNAFPGMDPAFVTRQAALNADASVSGLDRIRLSRSLRNLDRLRLLPVIRDRGLLDAVPIGRMPQRRRSGRREVPLPAQFAALHATLGAPEATALKAVFEIGVAAGHIDPDPDAAPEPRDLLEPSFFGPLAAAVRRAHPGASGHAYIARAVRAIRADDARALDPDRWRGLRARARRLFPGMNLDALSYLATRSAGCAPGQLDQPWLDRVLATADPRAVPFVKQGARMLNDLRKTTSDELLELLPAQSFVVSEARNEALALQPAFSAAFLEWREREDASPSMQKIMRCALRTLQDGVREDAASAFLPDQIERALAGATHLSDRMRNRYRAALGSLAYDPSGPAEQWRTEIVAAKAAGASLRDLHALGAVRSLASRETPARAPDEIDHAWATATLAELTERTSRARLRRGVKLINAARAAAATGPGTDDAPEPLRLLPDSRRRGRDELPDVALRDLQAYLAFRGLAPNTGRALRASLRTVFAFATDRRSLEGLPLVQVPLGKIIEEAERKAASRLPQSWPGVRKVVLQLEVELAIPWSADWAQLQRLAVATGIAATVNPVPEFARVAIPAGLSPFGVDREWCWQHESSLRPDLRITWSRNVARWDTLGTEPSIMSSGLFPAQRIGPMPARGERACHGLYPLPRSVEAALSSWPSGASVTWKQLNESAHFLWRHAREQGLFHRGEEPDADQLLADDVVRAVIGGAAHGIGPGPAREHGHRLALLRAHIRGAAASRSA